MTKVPSTLALALLLAACGTSSPWSGDGDLDDGGDGGLDSGGDGGLDGGGDGGGDGGPGDTSWLALSGPTIEAVARTGEEDVIVAGVAEDIAWVARVDAAGTTEWAFEAVDYPARIDAAVELAGGDVVLIGEYRSAGPGYDTNFILRLSPDGRVLSHQSLSHGLNQSVRSAFATADGGLLLAGSTDDDLPPEEHGFVIRLDSELGIVWQRRLTSLGTAVLEDASGDVVVLGQTPSGVSPAGSTLARLDAGGEPRGAHELVGVLVEAALQRADGDFLLAGTTAAAPDEPRDLWLARLGGDPLAVTWQVSISGPGSVSSIDLGELDGETVLVAVAVDLPDRPYDEALVLGLSPDGALAWQRLAGPSHPGSFAGLTTFPGGFAVGGWSEGGWLARAASVSGAPEAGCGLRDESRWAATPAPAAEGPTAVELALEPEGFGTTDADTAPRASVAGLSLSCSR